MASSTSKRCHYGVLGLNRDCTPEEIRSAYKKLALQRHPDKLVKSGLSQAEATAQFQELSHAYEVLSDPKERAWYDSHRSQILFSDPDSGNSVPDSVIPNLFSYFSNTVYNGYTDTGRGFYKVYSDVFNKIYTNEVNYCRKLGLGLDSVREAPLMGNLECPYEQVTAFYNYWLGFVTVMDFCWVDQYDVMAGPNRKSRRVMEEENKKLRKKAKKEYNETVRGLAEFVKKRDKRVIDMMVKKNAAMEKRKQEERERKKKAEREKMERMKAYEEPEWSRVNEEELEDLEEEEETERKGGKQEFYCVACGKKFKSEKQWKNHEQSKKHKEKVAELRESFADEDELMEEIEEDEEMDHGVDEINERFRGDFTIREDGNGNEAASLSNEEDGFVDAKDTDHNDMVEGVVAGDTDDESDEKDSGDSDINALEAMMFGHKSRHHHSPGATDELNVEVHILNEEIEGMEYDNQKSRRRRYKKERGKHNGEEATKAGARSLNHEATNHDNGQIEESSSESFPQHENESESTDNLGGNQKNSHQPIHKKAPVKVETNNKTKKSSKAKRGKATSRNSGNLCETCGEEFESRNKLHKHLGDTGHATLKYR